MRPDADAVNAGWGRRLGWFVRDLFGLITGQRAASTAVVVSVVALSAGLVVTHGRTRAAEASLVEELQSAEHRQVLIRVSGPAIADPGPLAQVLGEIGSVEWAVALGPTVDVRNVALPGGEPIAMRAAAGTAAFEAFGMGAAPASGAYVSYEGQLASGLESPWTGALVDAAGIERVLRGPVDLPVMLRRLGPVALTPSATGDLPAVSLVAFSVGSLDDVDAVTDTAVALFPAEHRRSLQVQRSGGLLAARDAVHNEFGSLAPTLLAALLVGTGTCVAAGALAGVLARRRDYGRRRALGASREAIGALVAVHAIALSVAGAAAGTGGAVLFLIATGSSAPPLDFLVAVVTAAVTIGSAASVLPAVAAARREPLRELRVP